MDDEQELKALLEEMTIEHRDMDVVIEQLLANPPIDFVRLQRLKKRKLTLKDGIAKIQSMLIPDIIA